MDVSVYLSGIKLLVIDNRKFVYRS